jgi:DNA repair protein RadC
MRVRVPPSAPLYSRHLDEQLLRQVQIGGPQRPQIAALILVHNHPSGDPKPSRDDIEMTRSAA